MRGLRTRARERALSDMAEILLTDLEEAREQINILQADLAAGDRRWEAVTEAVTATPRQSTDTTGDGIDNQTVLVISEMPDQATVMVLSMKKSGQVLLTHVKGDDVAIAGKVEHQCMVRGATVGEALALIQSHIETEEDAFNMPDLPLDLQDMLSKYEP